MTAHQSINTKVYEINKQEINKINIAESLKYARNIWILYDSPWINIKLYMTTKPSPVYINKHYTTVHNHNMPTLQINIKII